MTPNTPMRIAVLFENVQFADVACLDLLGNCSTWFIKASKEFGMGPLLPYARDMEFFYVASSTSEPALMTPSFRCVATHTYEDAPRDVDVLLVGGPPLSHRPEGSLKYMREVCADGREKVIMSTCVGGMWLAAAGCLDGVRATTNRGALGAARHFHPEVEWLDQRWVVAEKGHLKYWTAGGAGAGGFSIPFYFKVAFIFIFFIFCCTRFISIRSETTRFLFCGQ